MVKQTEDRNKKVYPFPLAARIWFLTSLVFGGGCSSYAFFFQTSEEIWICIPAAICAAVASIPVLPVLAIALAGIDKLPLQPVGKIKRLALACIACTLPYALAGGNLYTNSWTYSHNGYWMDYMLHVPELWAVLFSCSLVAVLVSVKALMFFFIDQQQLPVKLNMPVIK